MHKRLRVALFGSGEVGRRCLLGLLDRGHVVPVVYGLPAKAATDPLLVLARDCGIRVLTPPYFQKRSGEPISTVVEEYLELQVDLNLLASFTLFLPKQVLQAPRFNSLCFHPSLLPRYRGGSALQWQILEGEASTGATVFQLDAGVDTGPIVVQRGGVAIDPGETTRTLFFQKLAPLGAECLLEAVDRLVLGNARYVAQVERDASFQPLFAGAHTAVDLSRSVQQIERLIRACDPHPGARLRIGSHDVSLFDANLERGDGSEHPHVAKVDDGGLWLRLKDGLLRVRRVAANAGKEAAASFAQREQITAGTPLSASSS